MTWRSASLARTSAASTGAVNVLYGSASGVAGWEVAGCGDGPLAEFLSAHVVQAEEDHRWGELRLHVTSYRRRDLPPPELIVQRLPLYPSERLFLAAAPGRRAWLVA